MLTPREEVEFELGPGPGDKVDGFPRWYGMRDRGETGEWSTGLVLEYTHDGFVLIAYTNPVTGRSETWPFPAEGFEQELPGWPRRFERRCECGAHATYGTKGPHSDWCPMYRRPVAS
jgi:hypothetical protein